MVPIRSSDDTTAALDGCGSENSQQSMQCFFNVTTCNPKEDETRSAKILAPDQDQITWDEMLMDREDFFTPGGVSVVQTHKGSPWDDQVTIPSSTFASYREAFNYLKLALWNDMGRYGKTRVVSSSNRTCDLPEVLTSIITLNSVHLYTPFLFICVLPVFTNKTFQEASTTIFASKQELVCVNILLMNASQHENLLSFQILLY